jgi:hypothetical protein
MLDKLERAVDKISENSNRVAIILERHESRLDEGEKTNEAILKLIEKVEQKIDGVEDRVNQLSRFRWTSVGIGIALITTLKAPEIFSNFLTPGQNSSMIESVRVERLG